MSWLRSTWKAAAGAVIVFVAAVVGTRLWFGPRPDDVLPSAIVSGVAAAIGILIGWVAFIWFNRRAMPLNRRGRVTPALFAGFATLVVAGLAVGWLIDPVWTKCRGSNDGIPWTDATMSHTYDLDFAIPATVCASAGSLLIGAGLGKPINWQEVTSDD